MTTKPLKYAVCPGYVRSKVDGQLHLIAAPQLMALYKVDPRECVVIDPNQPQRVIAYQTSNAEGLGLTFLHPNYWGDYTLPTLKAQP